ncbi:MAG: hypothetical protein ACYDH2_02665 [Anaerolineaceae bacterium]
MTILNKYLSPIEIGIDQLLLDPNNPRFADFEDASNPVPESRISEERVQRDAFERMKSKRFDVNELRDTIKAVGYLPMDRIVIRKWGTTLPQKYVVVEGNRRVTALKWLLELHETARETLDSEQIDNFKTIPALLLDEESAPDMVRFVLPGLRHVSGVKEWGPYQRAKAVHLLRKAGESPRDVAQSLGLSTQAANLLWRSYLGLEQMSQDNEFGEFADPRMYSYFEEINRHPNVKNWLGWNDEQEKFTNEGHIKELYSWIVGEMIDGDDRENRSDPKLPEAKSIRDLSKFVDDPNGLSIFRRPGGTLTHALSKYESEHREAWQGALLNAKSTLSTLNPDDLRSMKPEDIDLLDDLINRIRQLLSDRSKLMD